MRPLALLKTLICRSGVGRALMEYCHRCGRRVRPGFWAPPSTTPVHEMLDRAILAAIEEGAGGIELPDERAKRERRARR